MLVPVAKEEFVNASSLSETHFDQRRMCAHDIDMLLRFGLRAEVTAGLLIPVLREGTLCEIGCMSHPVVQVFGAPTNVAGGSSFGLRERCHQRNAVLRPSRRGIGVDAVHIPLLSVLSM